MKKEYGPGVGKSALPRTVKLDVGVTTMPVTDLRKSGPQKSMYEILRQTAPDGATRTFEAYRDDNNGVWLTIRETDRDCRVLDTQDIRFEPGELAKLLIGLGRI